MKTLAAVLLVLAAAVYLYRFPTVRVRQVQVPVLGLVARGNNLSDDEIIRLDGWCEQLQQDGDGHSSWGWRDGPIFPGASRVAWDDDPRPAPQLVSVPSNYNATRVGVNPWCLVASRAQLESAARRRREAFDREWRQTGPDSWERRDGTGWMSTGGSLNLGTIMPGETKTITIPIPDNPSPPAVRP